MKIDREHDLVRERFVKISVVMGEVKPTREDAVSLYD